MAELSTIAPPYATALFEAVKASGAAGLGATLTQLEGVAALAQDSQMAAALASPGSKAESLLAVFGAAQSGGLKSELQGLLGALLENKRAAVLPEVLLQFKQLKNAFESASDAVITSAFALDATQVNDIAAALSKKFGKTLKPVVKIDESLIGGVRVAVGDEVLDSSVRTQLEKMRAALVG